ncbi:MAG: hypothetical protein DHS20C11_20850 [Lysobacteraceae bacterium]|nr:MAG: hypothetical protein DHS20C11_20850 [Xanthomonadaceae bacterium]
MQRLFGLIVFALASAANAQVFVENFDSSVAGWDSYPSAGQEQFSSEDLNGSLTSGSAEVTAVTNEHGVRRCVDTNIPAGVVDFGMYGFLPVSNTAVGQTVQCTFTLYLSDGCVSALGSFNTAAVPASGIWANTAATTNAIVVVESVFAQCGVGSGNVNPGDVVRVDRIYVGPDGTLPVELMLFGVD